MNVLFLIAAVLIVALGAAHSYLGERYLLIPLFRRTNLPRILGSASLTRGTLRLAWHVTTIAWLGMGALLTVAAKGLTVPVALIGQILAWTSFASAACSFLWARGRHLSWVVFLLIAVLLWAGSR